MGPPDWIWKSYRHPVRRCDCGLSLELSEDVFKLTASNKIFVYKATHYTKFFELLSSRVKQLLGSKGRSDLYKFDSMIAFKELCVALPQYEPARIQFSLGDNDNLRVETHATPPVLPDWVESELEKQTAEMERVALGLLLLGNQNNHV